MPDDLMAEASAAGPGPADEWVTVAELARRLAKTPRQARRYADQLEDKDKDAREEVIGGRHVRVLVVRWLAAHDLFRKEGRRARASRGQGRGQGGRRTQSSRPAASLSLSPSESLPPLVMKLLGEKDARIADLQRQVEGMTRQIGALEDVARLREANLNAVLQLQGLKQVGDASPTVPAAGAQEDTAAERAPDASRRSWWQWLRGRRG